MLAPGSASLDQCHRTSTSSPRINPHDHKGRFEGRENTSVTRRRACGAGRGEIELFLL